MNNKIVVSFDKNWDQNMSGSVSQVSWKNPTTVKALRQMFACKPDEQIIGLEIRSDSIVALFKRG